MRRRHYKHAFQKSSFPTYRLVHSYAGLPVAGGNQYSLPAGSEQSSRRCNIRPAKLAGPHQCHTPLLPITTCATGHDQNQPALCQSGPSQRTLQRKVAGWQAQRLLVQGGSSQLLAFWCLSQTHRHARCPNSGTGARTDSLQFCLWRQLMHARHASLYCRRLLCNPL